MVSWRRRRVDMLSQADPRPRRPGVCGWPSFPSYVIYAAEAGRRVRTVPLADLRYDLDALLGAITDRTKLVYSAIRTTRPAR